MSEIIEPTDETTPDNVSDESTTAEVDDDDTTPEGAESLGDAGKKALDSMKSKWKAERDRRRELEGKLASAAPASDSETVDVDAIRRDALKAANSRILRSEIKAAAAGKFADPSDAYLYLDLSSFEVDENGDVDSDEIADAIQNVLTSRPHLAAAQVKRFQGTGDGGAARKATGPSQLTRADLAKMSPAQIVKAKADGRLTSLLSSKD